jgi:DNA-binding MarR family transcriptional regulator
VHSRFRRGIARVAFLLRPRYQFANMKRMAVPGRPAETTISESPPAPPLTGPQRRILRLLREGDLIWEIAEDPGHCTVYNEKRGRPQRIRTAAVTGLEQQGWVQRCPNPQPDRLDSWELTPRGRALMPSPSPPPVRKPKPVR